MTAVAIDKLFSKRGKKGVKRSFDYCIWKKNEHIKKGTGNQFKVKRREGETRK